MHPIIRAYVAAGLVSREQMLEHAKLAGDASYFQMLAALNEAEQTRQNSVAMVVVTGDPPGKNICAMIRKLVVDRTKLIVIVQQGTLPSGSFERLLRASAPDVEKKLRIMDAGQSLSDAVSSAEKNRHYSPKQALEVFCDAEDAENFANEIRGGSLTFDPTLIKITPMEIASDDSEAIQSAIGGEDLSAMHRVLDPHVFSNQDSLKDYKTTLRSLAGASNESLIEGIKQKFPGQQMYVHFSSREKPPQVPDRAINRFAGGSGPVGIYAYPLDAQFSFAADRQFAFVLKPKVEVLNTRTYTAAQLQVDIERLSQMVDLKRPNKLWLRYKDESVNVGPPFNQLWYLISRIPKPDEEFPIGATGTGFGDPQKGRDLFIQLGYTAIEDSIGIIYGTEPKQILFLTDESFEVVDLVQNPETFSGRDAQKSLVEVAIDPVLAGRSETKQRLQGVIARIQKIVAHEFKDIDDELEIQDPAQRARFIKGRIANVKFAVDKEKLDADSIVIENLVKEFLSSISPSRELAISKLDDILANKLGDSYHELQYLGTGRNGSAYKTPDGLIIKITTDPVEAASAEALCGKACEHLYNVHEVSQINENVWVILQEELDPLPHEYCEEFDLAMEIIETIGAGHALREGDANGVKEVMVNSNHTDLCILVAEIMKKFGVGGMLREISQHGLSADFHSGNVKLRNGKPVLTDLGTSGDDKFDVNERVEPDKIKTGEAYHASNVKNFKRKLTIGQIVTLRPSIPKGSPGEDNSTPRVSFAENPDWALNVLPGGVIDGDEYYIFRPKNETNLIISPRVDDEFADDPDYDNQWRSSVGGRFGYEHDHADQQEELWSIGPIECEVFDIYRIENYEPIPVKKVSSFDGMKVNEFAGLGSASTGSPSNMRGSNSSAWAGGRMVLSKPEQHVPEDENASERDQALDQDIIGGDLDWGIGKPGRGY